MDRNNDLIFNEVGKNMSPAPCRRPNGILEPRRQCFAPSGVSWTPSLRTWTPPTLTLFDAVRTICSSGPAQRCSDVAE
jgi:hypothetical protein